jgi:hypothetical protein
VEDINTWRAIRSFSHLRIRYQRSECHRDLIGPDEITEERIVPSMFDRRVGEAMTRAPREAA